MFATITPLWSASELPPSCTPEPVVFANLVQLSGIGTKQSTSHLWPFLWPSWPSQLEFSTTMLLGTHIEGSKLDRGAHSKICGLQAQENRTHSWKTNNKSRNALLQKQQQQNQHQQHQQQQQQQQDMKGSQPASKKRCRFCSNAPLPFATYDWSQKQHCSPIGVMFKVYVCVNILRYRKHAMNTTHNS